jgi:hypothetical protein
MRIFFVKENTTNCLLPNKELTMRIAIVLTSFLLLSTCIFCEKNPSSSDTFKNELTLGTGMSGFQLTGVSTTFTLAGGSQQIFWRLESAADMAGSDVTISLEKISGGAFVSYKSFPYPHVQDYGHIMLSSFTVTEPGSYRATGILVTGNKTVSQVSFSVQ